MLGAVSPFYSEAGSVSWREPLHFYLAGMNYSQNLSTAMIGSPKAWPGTGRVEIRICGGHTGSLKSFENGMRAVPQEEEEEEGLHGVFKRLRRNGHQLCRVVEKKKKRGYTVCSSGYAATDTS
jgi:hypothetical protein